MRWTWLIVLFATHATTARAGDDPDDEGVVPRRVAVRLDGTSAHLSVRLTFDVVSGGLETTAIPLPSRAVVTAAAVTIAGVTHRLALTRAEDASEQIAKLRGHAEGPSPAWAINLYGGAGSVSIDVLAPKAEHVELAFDLEAPTCFYRDARYLDIPPDWRDALDRSVARAPVAPADELAANCAMEDKLTWIALPSAELAAKPAGDARIGARGERLPLGGADVAHVELDIARELGAVPRDLHTAIVIDASRSLTPEGAETERAIVQAYLQAVPRSEVQVIAYERTAHALLPGWALASANGAAIDRALRALPPRNGSNLDAGLAEAARWLAHTAGTRRVIVFSDELVASRLGEQDAAELGKLLPAGTLVHAVALDTGSGELARDDDAMFAGLAKATEGMSVRGRVDSHGDVDATLLARPITLDLVKVTAAGWNEHALTENACNGQDTMKEGATCSWWGQGTASSGAVTIEGMVWGHRVVRSVAPDSARARALARTLTAVTGFDTDLQEKIELAARAVNSAWSLFARWGGQDGYGTLEGCGCGTGTSGFGSASGSSHTMMGVVHRTGLELQAQLQPVIDACHARGVTVTLEVETTLQELVDVGVTVIGGGDKEPQLRACITEGAWNTMLSIPDAPAHARTQVAFHPR